MRPLHSTIPSIDTDMDSLRAALLHRRDELRQQVHHELPDPSSAHEVSDRKEDAARSEADLVEAAREAVEFAELGDIDAALRRMDEGVFGQCVRCGESIAADRLQANPAALRCTPCQTAHERSTP